MEYKKYFALHLVDLITLCRMFRTEFVIVFLSASFKGWIKPLKQTIIEFKTSVNF